MRRRNSFLHPPIKPRAALCPSRRAAYILGLGCPILAAPVFARSTSGGSNPPLFNRRTELQSSVLKTRQRTDQALDAPIFVAQTPPAPRESIPTDSAAPAPAVAAPPVTSPVPPAATAPVFAAPPIARDAQGEALVTNVFADTDLKQALSDISAQTGVTIVADSSVQGVVSADLRAVPFERALAVILQAGGYSFAKLDGYYLVGASVPENPNFHLLSRLEFVELQHVRPETVLDLLALSYGRYLSAEGNAPPPPQNTSQVSAGASPFAISPRRVGLSRALQGTTSASPVSAVANPPEPTRIAISAPPALIGSIKAAIAQLDQPRVQVVIEAAVLEVSQESLKDFSFNFVDRVFGRRSIGLNTTPNNSNVTFSSVTGDDISRLSALVQRGAARLRANPRLATADGQTAEIEVGRESYYSINTGSSAFPNNTLEVIRSGIFLRITPRVWAAAGEVTTRLEPEVRDVSGRGPDGLPEITFRRAATNLRVRDGQSIIIGGLINEFNTQTRTKIPLLGDLPLVGKAFRGVSARQTRTETIIIITPRILSEGVPLDAVQSGTLRYDVQSLRAGQTPRPFAFPASPK